MEAYKGASYLVAHPSPLPASPHCTLEPQASEHSNFFLSPMTNDTRSSSNQVQSDLEAEVKSHVGDANINGPVTDASESSTPNVSDKQLQDMLAWAHEYSLSQGLDEDTIEHLEQFVKVCSGSLTDNVSLE